MTTLQNLVDEYCTEASAIIARGEKRPVPDLLQAVFAHHRGVAVPFDVFVQRCAEQMRCIGYAKHEEAEELRRYGEARSTAAK